MKPTTQARIDAVMTAMYTYAHIGDCEEADIKAAIELALKDQDRETREACAAAMLELPYDMQHMDAHDACINTQAV